LPSIDATSYTSPNSEPRPARLSAIVLHHGAGTRQSDLATLTSPASGVSAHYYVCRDGTIYQLVPDDRRAWHAGVSALDGVPDVNDYSIGIEAEHTTDPRLIAAGAPAHTDWPPAQQAALAWLVRLLITRYPRITARRVVSHRAVALPAGRKPDPSHAPFEPDASLAAWVDGVVAVPPATPPPPPADPYTADSPILAPAVGTPDAYRAAWQARCGGGPHYSDAAIAEIAGGYWAVCGAAGVDPWLAAAQGCHETGNLRSFWCARPRRNPAGLGVTGEIRPDRDPDPGPGWALDAAAHVYRRGLSFAGWVDQSIPAHVGRLLRYALPATARLSPEQARIVAQALAARGLPVAYFGTAPTLAGLDGRWAVGQGYGARIAAIANVLRGTP
jgi:hypothetical protein